MKKVLICCFSATGNTKFACEYIKQKLVNADVTIMSIGKEPVPDFTKFDLIGFATFTDWLDPHVGMKIFINSLPIYENKPAFIFNTCAGMSGHTQTTMRKWLKNKGFKVVAGFTLNTPESYPPLVVKGHTRENFPQPKNLKKFKEFIKKLISILDQEENMLREISISIGLFNRILPVFSREKSKKNMGKKYVDEKLCNECGICAKACGHNAIVLKPKPVFNESKCQGCWACYNKCPQKAIYADSLKGGGYYTGPLAVYRNKFAD